MPASLAPRADVRDAQSFLITAPRKPCLRLCLTLVVLQRLSDLAHMAAMYPDGLMQLLASHMELLGPIVNIRRKLRIDLVRIVWALLLGNVLLFRNCCWI